MTASGSTQPSPEQLMWVLQIVGGDEVVEVAPLTAGGSPWAVRWRGGDAGEDGGRAVLRVDSAADAELQARAETAMPVADRQGVPVPNVLGSRVDDDRALLLIEWIEGDSVQSTEPDPVRLRTLGATAALIFRADIADIALPEVSRPISAVDFAALRGDPPHPLLERAARRLEAGAPEGRTGLVHGDLWAGNTLWKDSELVAVLDWDCVGVGAAGIDLGSLRLDAAMCWGPEAAALVLAGWQDETGESAHDLAYWDAVAAVNTPPDLGWFVERAAQTLGRADLTREVMVPRRDAFLADALERLDATR